MKAEHSLFGERKEKSKRRRSEWGIKMASGNKTKHNYIHTEFFKQKMKLHLPNFFLSVFLEPFL